MIFDWEMRKNDEMRKLVQCTGVTVHTFLVCPKSPNKKTIDIFLILKRH